MQRNKFGQFIKGSQMKSNNPRWNGGKTKDRYGYIKILKYGHPMADSKGYVYEHRFNMAQKLGRLLTRDELIHHIDHNRLNNRIENLKIVTRQNHIKIHPPF